MKKILVVDDSAVDLKNLERIVSDAGAMVITASSGAEALAKARQNLPAMVLMVPSGATRRMRWPVYSQNQIAPSGPRTTPKGLSICAAVAGPPSPLPPLTPVPAKVAMDHSAAVAVWARKARRRSVRMVIGR